MIKRDSINRIRFLRKETDCKFSLFVHTHTYTHVRAHTSVCLIMFKSRAINSALSFKRVTAIGRLTQMIPFCRYLWGRCHQQIWGVCLPLLPKAREVLSLAFTPLKMFFPERRTYPSFFSLCFGGKLLAYFMGELVGILGDFYGKMNGYMGGIKYTHTHTYEFSLNNKCGAILYGKD